MADARKQLSAASLAHFLNGGISGSGEFQSVFLDCFNNGEACRHSTDDDARCLSDDDSQSQLQKQSTCEGKIALFTSSTLSRALENAFLGGKILQF